MVRGTVRSIVRISGWTGNTALTVEAEFFGRDRPRVGFRDRHGEIRGLTVEEYINRLGQDLIPLAERCGRVMREALGDVAFTAVGAPEHREASATVVGGAGSTPRRQEPTDDGFAT